MNLPRSQAVGMVALLFLLLLIAWFRYLRSFF